VSRSPTTPRPAPGAGPADAEIDALARVTDADEAPAKARWHRDAPRKFKGLIDATEAEE
jgi:hypothetical protein